MIPEATWREKAIVTTLLMAAGFIMVFFMYGVLAAFRGVPAKRAIIAELTIERNLERDRANLLISKMVEREKQYRVAVKFDRLFMLASDPNQVMDFEAIEELIRERKDFYKPVKIKQGG